jgi:rhomboid family GlyGly-CTERM serine protease
MEPTTTSPGAAWPWWTISLTVGLVLTNTPLWFDSIPAAWLTTLEFERTAVVAGEWWRILTNNLIHWDVKHFYFDVGAFVFAGWLSERYFHHRYPVLLLWLALCVGVSGLFFLDDGVRLRGLSGVNAGQFAALLWVEIALARREPERWRWVLPVLVLFIVWVCYGAVTGRAFLLGGDPQVAGWAHAVGAGAAVVFLLFRKRPK